MAKEMTKREKFGMAIEMAKANGNEMLVEFFNHEIELLDRKKSNGNAKANEKMDKQVELVYTALEEVGRPVKASELIAETNLTELENENGMVTPQKVSALLKKLVDSGRVVKVVDKKNTLFAIKEED